ncbi:MAG TPA: energy transducer TonB [Terriglobales bacterium]|nr:energy transducer TonB [Terriglobales bacterium]
MRNHALVEEEGRAEAQPRAMATVIEIKPVEIPVQLDIFSDCLLETSGAQRRLRGWSLLFSLVLQGILLSILVILPLMFTDVLPAKQLVTYLIAVPPPPPPPPPMAAAVKPINVTSNIVNGQLLAPTSIPTRIKILQENEAPPVNATGGVPGGVPGGIPGGQLGGVLGGIISATPPPVRMPELSKRVRVSQGISEGLLLKKIVPEYPPLARTARIDGVVVLAAVISKDGIIENLRLVSGHPMLAPAAIAAVKQWRYRPYLLDGMPVEIETTINVIFSFQNQ